MRSIVPTAGTIRLPGNRTGQRRSKQLEPGHQMGACSAVCNAVIRFHRTVPAAVASGSRVLPLQVRTTQCQLPWLLVAECFPYRCVPHSAEGTAWSWSTSCGRQSVDQ
jgi:hypothetical protein